VTSVAIIVAPAEAPRAAAAPGPRRSPSPRDHHSVSTTTAMIARNSRSRSSTRCEMKVSCGSACRPSVPGVRPRSDPVEAGRLAWRAGASVSAVDSLPRWRGGRRLGERRQCRRTRGGGAHVGELLLDLAAPVLKSRTADVIEVSISRAAPCTSAAASSARRAPSRDDVRLDVVYVALQATEQVAIVRAAFGRRSGPSTISATTAM